MGISGQDMYHRNIYRKSNRKSLLCQRVRRRFRVGESVACFLCWTNQFLLRIMVGKFIRFYLFIAEYDHSSDGTVNVMSANALIAGCQNASIVQMITETNKMFWNFFLNTKFKEKYLINSLIRQRELFCYFQEKLPAHPFWKQFFGKELCINSGQRPQNRQFIEQLAD